ncbi:MAG: response regulator [candidate division NC10 bacterium]
MGGVIAAVDDLFFWAKILETAERLNVPLALVRSPGELLEKARAFRPALVIVDLNAEGCRPLEALRQVKADPELKDTPVLGFYSHVQHELKASAAEAGCDRILARSAFTAQLPDILRPYATL